MATYYRSSGSSDIYSRPNASEFAPGNAYMFPGEANNVSASKEIQVLSSFGGEASQAVEIQDSRSWRDQEDNDRTCFPVMMCSTTGQGLSLGLISQIETSRGNNDEYATQVVSGFHNSKYLKAAQELLDEAVNVKKALKQFQPERDKTEEEYKEKNLQESSTNPDLPQSERQELQNKLSKLLSILDEVDRRYKQYYHQMQIVVSSFDVIAGCGAAKPYTALALQTISRHFRCLRDAVSGQILVIRRSLGGGEHEDGRGGGGVCISRLRNVDQKVRQQRALQRLGVMQPPHAWRPQRGLPDSSVLILRAWLFEHFLHPYPKDSDKIMLARQTGLSRGQVSNWFINARVRLWKPMVEEMYKEEFTDALEENVIDLSSANNRTETTESQEQQLVSSMGQSTVASGGGDNRLMMVTEMTRNGSGGMSLTLGIPDNYENTNPGTSFQYLNSDNGQHRLGSSQLLQDFVA